MQGHIRKRTHTTKTGKEVVNWYVVVDLGRDANNKRRQKMARWLPHPQGSRSRSQQDRRRPARRHLQRASEADLARLVSGEVAADSRNTGEAKHVRVLPTQHGPPCASYPGRSVTPGDRPWPAQRSLRHPLVGWPAQRTRGLSAKTVRFIHTILHKSLADAIDADLLVTNVAERAKPPRPRTQSAAELRFWTPEQLRSFLVMVEGHRLEAAWHLSAMTGMRRGEVLGLRWADVDLDNNRVQVRQALVSVSYELIFSTPKNHCARVIDLDPSTTEQLRAHREQRAEDNREWGADYQDGDLLLCKENGEPVHPQTYSQAFERLVAKSDLPSIRLHDLRHTHATIAIKAGIPTKVISERLGHESPAFTLKQYAHVIPGMQADAAVQVARLIFDSADRDDQSP